MASAVDICNIALGYLGDDATVSSIDPPEGSTQAEQCARFYPIARRMLLSMHDWSFATQRVALSVLSVAPPHGWAYAYGVPARMVKARNVFMGSGISTYTPITGDVAPYNSGDMNPQPFIVEALSDQTPVIYTNVENAILRYTEDVTNTTRYQPLFELALARLLAALLAGPIIKGTEGAKVAAEHRRALRDPRTGTGELSEAIEADANAKQFNAYTDAEAPALAARR